MWNGGCDLFFTLNLNSKKFGLPYFHLRQVTQHITPT